MVSLNVLFSFFLVLFAVIGAMRGWAKELLVTASLVLGLFLLQILDRHVGVYRTALAAQEPTSQFMIQGGLMVLMAFFGYQTPRLRALEARVLRERFQDVVLGILMGALNGYLLFGSLWYFLDKMGYDQTALVSLPADPALLQRFQEIIEILPPNILPIPHIYFAVGVVFVFIIVVFV